MKFKIISVFLITVLILTGCGSNKQSSSSNIANTDNSAALLTLENMITEGKNTDEIGEYISGISSSASESEMTFMVSRLINLHTYDKFSKTSSLYTYDNLLPIYKENFNYTWDIAVIDKLEDSEAKTYLKGLSSSFYKISTHPNYLDVDTNYDQLLSLENISDEIKKFLEINISKRDLILEGALKGEINYVELRNNIIRLEDYMTNYPNSLLNMESENLYRSMINMYFVGTDGLSPFDYSNNRFRTKFYDTLLDTSENYSDYIFTSLCNNFLELTNNKNQLENVDYVSVISNFKQLGLASSRKIEQVTAAKSTNLSIIYPKVLGFDDKNIEDKINTTITDAIIDIKDHLSWDTNENGKYSISYYVSYGSYKYLSIQLTGSYYDHDTNTNDNYQRNLNFDISTGENVKLSDLLDLPFDEYSEDMAKLIKQNSDSYTTDTTNLHSLDKEPEFLISNLSLVLYFDTGEYGFNDEYPVYVYIDHSKLKNFLDFRTLFK